MVGLGSGLGYESCRVIYRSGPNSEVGPSLPALWPLRRLHRGRWNYLLCVRASAKYEGEGEGDDGNACIKSPQHMHKHTHGLVLKIGIQWCINPFHTHTQLCTNCSYPESKGEGEGPG